MNATLATESPSNQAVIGDEALIANVVDVLYGKMLDDYRINRFFFTRSAADQTAAFKQFIYAVLGGRNKELYNLLDDYFTVAFARTNAKPSLVSGNDFGFLLELIGGRLLDEPETSTIIMLCPAHSFLLKLGPNDDHYDVVMELLAASLQELGISGEAAAQIMEFAELGRAGVLGRGQMLEHENPDS